MQDSPFKALERKIDELIALCSELNRENAALKAEADAWQQERQHLIDRNEQARTRVAAMLDRLKAMEQDA